MSSPVRLEEVRMLPPEILGYTFIRFLGSGAWNAVFLYEQEGTGKQYACKFLSPTKAAAKKIGTPGMDLEEIVRRSSLGRNTASLPAVAYNSLEHLQDGTPYIREEFIPKFLTDMLEPGTPASRTFIISQFMSNIALGLDSLHTQLHIPHGDLHEGNIGCSATNHIVLSDFGNSTVGLSRKGAGYFFTRAPERFVTEGTRPASDIWSFGALVYRLFTGKHILEDELKDKEMPEEIIQVLYYSPGAWNLRMTEKLERSTIPRSYKRLLLRCLVHEDDRIQNGSELVREVEKAHRRNERMHSPLFWSSIVATAALVATLSWGIRQHYTSTESLEAEIAKRDQRIEYEEKIRAARLVLAGESYSEDLNDNALINKIKGYESIFGDRKTALAAFFNPRAVYQAIQRNNQHVDFNTIQNTLYIIDPDLRLFILDTTESYLDSGHRENLESHKKRTIQEWQWVGEQYKNRCNQLIREYKQAQEVIRGMNPSPPSLLYGVGESQEVRDARRAQDNSVETLMELTGRNYDEIKEGLRDGTLKF